MKIQLVVIGKTTSGYLSEGIDEYVKRISRYVPFELRTLPDVKVGRGSSSDRQRELEGDALLSCLQPGDWLVLLDEKGREMTSREFAQFLDKKMVTLPRNLVLAIGGPYGFSREVYQRANEQLSLSRMTFSHEMVRLFIVEQIYRAMTILRGEPYHHD